MEELTMLDHYDAWSNRPLQISMAMKRPEYSALRRYRCAQMEQIMAHRFA
jgi:hypothetical protein